MQENIDDPLSSSIKETISLFKEDLSNVTFPDISHNVLENLIEQVRSNATELEEANAKVISAREALETSQNELIQKCIRGLAYARVYAEDRDDLLEKISRINLGKSSKIQKKVNRSEKSDAPVSEGNVDKKSCRSQKKDVDPKSESVVIEN